MYKFARVERQDREREREGENGMQQEWYSVFNNFNKDCMKAKIEEESVEMENIKLFLNYEQI